MTSDDVVSREDTLPKCLQARIKELSKRVALRRKDLGIWKEISWEEYGDHVRYFSLGLISLGLTWGDRVSILSWNRPEWLYTDLAVQSSGAISVGVYPTNPSFQVHYILDDSQSKFVVVEDQEQTDKILEIKNKLPLLEKTIVIDMKGLWKYKNPSIMSFNEVEELGKEYEKRDPNLWYKNLSKTISEDCAIIVYTSGTTGPPKGAMLSHRNILSLATSLANAVRIYNTDSVVSYLPLCHAAERVFSVIIPIKFGVAVNFAESPETVLENIYEISPTIFLGVPRIWEKLHSRLVIKLQDATYFKQLCCKMGDRILKRIAEFVTKREKIPFRWKIFYWFFYLILYRAIKDKLGLLRARVCIASGAPIALDVLAFFRSLGVKVRNAYGLTEAVGGVFLQQGDDPKVGSCGTPMEGVEYKIDDDGEILIRSPSVFMGYFRDPDATRKILAEGWLHTGDIGKVDEDGEIVIYDRKKDIIITAQGHNIAPSEIENKLKFSPYIAEAIVIGDKRKYITCLIQIDYENVGKWAQVEGIPYTTYKSLAQTPEVNRLIQKEINSVNKYFARDATIKKFRIIEKELDQDDEEVTPTHKVRRKQIDEFYKEIIEKMYKE